MRYLLLFLWGLVSISSANAQSFRAYLELGINASQIDGDDLAGYHQSGLRLGAQVAYPLADQWWLRSGLIYSGKGSRHSERDIIYQVWRLNYLEMPFVVQYDMFDQVFFTLGATANYLIQAKRDVGFGFVPDRQGLRDFDFCYTAGVWYHPFDNASFAITVIDGLFSASPVEFYRNRSLAFSLFYQLGTN